MQTTKTDDYFLKSAAGVGFFFEEKAFGEGGQLVQPKALCINKIGHGARARLPAGRALPARAAGAARRTQPSRSGAATLQQQPRRRGPLRGQAPRAC